MVLPRAQDLHARERYDEEIRRRSTLPKELREPPPDRLRLLGVALALLGLWAISSQGAPNRYAVACPPYSPQTYCWLFGTTASVTSFAFGPDGSHIALGLEDGSVEIWDWISGKLLTKLKGANVPIRALSFDRSGELLAVGYGEVYREDLPEEASVLIWELSSEQLLRSFLPVEEEGPSGRRFISEVQYLGFFPNRPWLLVGYGFIGDDLRLLNIQSGQEVWTIDGLPKIWSPAFAIDPRGQWVYANAPQKVVILHPQTGEVLDEWASPERRWAPVSMKVSADGRLLLVGNMYHRVYVWNLQERKLRMKISTQGQLTQADLHPNGTLIAFIHFMHILKSDDVWQLEVWPVSSNRPLWVEVQGSRIGAVEFSPDGRYLATLEAGGVKIRFLGL